MSDKPQLAGQTVVVIGGTSDIGLETARRARAEGADAIVTPRDAERPGPAASSSWSNNDDHLSDATAPDEDGVCPESIRAEWGQSGER